MDKIIDERQRDKFITNGLGWQFPNPNTTNSEQSGIMFH